MKSISSALSAHFATGETTLCVLWKLTRVDGTILAFTTHDQDLTYDDGTGARLYPAFTGFTNTANDSKSDMSVDNMDVTGFLDSSAITEADIRAGLYDDAAIEMRIVNWADLTMGDMKIRAGNTGQVVMKNGSFQAEIRGLTQYLTTIIGSTYGPICRAELFSDGVTIGMGQHYLCRKNVAAYSQTGSVLSSPDAVTILVNSGLKQKG